MQCRGAKSFADDLVTGQGVVFSRAASTLRSVETKPSIGWFVFCFLYPSRCLYAWAHEHPSTGEHLVLKPVSFTRGCNPIKDLYLSFSKIFVYPVRCVHMLMPLSNHIPAAEYGCFKHKKVIDILLYYYIPAAVILFQILSRAKSVSFTRGVSQCYWSTLI